VAADIPEVAAAVRPPFPGRGRGRAIIVIVAILAALGVAAITSTHAALSGGDVGWGDPVSGHRAGLLPATAAERQQSLPTAGYSSVLWASRPGGEVQFGFTIHNGGPVPVTLTGVALRTFDSGVVNVLSAAGSQLGPVYGQTAPFRPATLGPGDSLPVAITERVVCDPTIRQDARLPDNAGGHSVQGDATSPVVLHYRVLGLPASQTLSLGSPVLVLMPYRACR
jgi:hypothetical protein